ncbi:C45 family peptidase [Dongia rigui]|uniref:C45 family peptidase n=1 Tax=Dongia rigui TaxID=940149 RepID=A0ABU5E2X4_9PROT|nr:C45 family peptidase [Dongia rigui]MDY0873545.1 C45 family peptidase [Dongia rigui]
MIGDCPILDLRGDARQRGRQHGEAARDLIARHIDLWRRETEKQTALPHREARDRMLGGTHFPAAIRRWTPHLWEELQGIAEGAGQALDDVLALNLTDEQWWFFAERQAEACTSFAYRDAAGVVWSGQNLDITGWMDGLQVILRYGGPDGHAVAATLAGTIGMTGINAQGLSICCNTLLQLPHRADGLPALCAIRGFLDQPDLAGGEAFMNHVTHASGLHYLVADPTGWLGLACDADGVRRVESGPDWYCHTNHCKDTPERASRSSGDRLAAMESALATANVKMALTTQPICRDGTSPTDPIGFTIFSALWRNMPNPTARLAAGPPNSARYRDIALSPISGCN